MQVGVDLFGRGLLLLPFIGVVAVMRGLLLAVVALLYVLFDGAALLRRSLARGIGLARSDRQPAPCSEHLEPRFARGASDPVGSDPGNTNSLSIFTDGA